MQTHLAEWRTIPVGALVFIEHVGWTLKVGLEKAKMQPGPS